MGTTLTGATPQDTYDSLIKVTDNGPLSGSLKVLTDGLGNNSALSLSTAAASIAGTLAVTSSASAATTLASRTSTSTNGTSAVPFFDESILMGPSTNMSKIQFGNSFNSNDGTFLKFVVNNSAGSNNSLDVMTLTSAGNVGIGTSAPAVPLDVVGNIRSSTGILFGADTAAANLLDDYEEGTWTMGVSFGGASVGVTTSSNTGTYTKIGRQVTVNGFINLTSKGSSTGNALITGLPFTIANSASTYSAASLRLNEITFQNQFQAFGDPNTTTIILQEITELGVSGGLTNSDFANTSDIMVSLTYFV